MSENSIESRLETARVKFPKRRLYVADSPAGELILGNPKSQDYDAFIATALSDEPSEKARASKNLLLACSVDPSPQEMKELLQEWPALNAFPDVQLKIKYCLGTAKADTEKK